MVQLLIQIPSDSGAVPEWSIIELQGDLETKSSDSIINGQFIGDLHFTKKRRSSPDHWPSHSFRQTRST